MKNDETKAQREDRSYWDALVAFPSRLTFKVDYTEGLDKPELSGFITK